MDVFSVADVLVVDNVVVDSLGSCKPEDRKNGPIRTVRTDQSETLRYL